MSNGQTNGGSPISLGQLVALNEEMAALVRAGVPLEQGLGEIGRDMPGRVGEIATQLGERMQAGESLSQILATDEKVFPPVWRAVADRQQAGEVFENREAIPVPFPPLLGWLVMAGADQPGISDTLLETADSYRRRAARAATWTAMYLPILLTAVFGGAATVLQGVATFGPICRMLYDLGQPF